MRWISRFWKMRLLRRCAPRNDIIAALLAMTEVVVLWAVGVASPPFLSSFLSGGGCGQAVTPTAEGMTNNDASKML